MPRIAEVETQDQKRSKVIPFLVLVRYYHTFVLNYSDITSPLISVNN